MKLFPLLAVTLVACGNPKTTAQAVEAGTYSAEMEICLRKNTCNEYVECSNAASRKYNVDVTPDTCVTDAGKDAN